MWWMIRQTCSSTSFFNNAVIKNMIFGIFNYTYLKNIFLTRNGKKKNWDYNLMLNSLVPFPISTTSEVS